MGFRYAGLGDDEEAWPAITHAIWADNVWVFGRSVAEVNDMVAGLTAALQDKLQMRWKPESLEVMIGNGTLMVNRGSVWAAAGGAGRRERFREVSSMRVLGDLVSADGGSTEAWFHRAALADRAYFGQSSLLQDKVAPLPWRLKGLQVGAGGTLLYASETWHFTAQLVRDLRAWEGGKARRMGKWKRKDTEFHRGFMRRTEDVLCSIFENMGCLRLHTQALARQHRWVARALLEEWVPGEPSPLQLLLRYRDRQWFRRTSEEMELRGRYVVLTACFRHAKGGRIRALEDVFIEHYGEAWKDVAADLDAWDRSRPDFLRKTLARMGCRVDVALKEDWGCGAGREAVPCGSGGARGGFGQSGRARGGGAGEVTGKEAERDRRRMEEGGATLEELWRLPSVGGAHGFAMAVDSANVAGWLSGRRAVAGADPYLASMLGQAWESLELLTFHLGSPPFSTEWVSWIPREHNKAADWLASRALDTHRDAWYWHGHWRRFVKEEMVVFSDAGVRTREDGVVEVGLGWVMLQRSSGTVVAAASCALKQPAEARQDDVNRWELRAAVGGMGALVFLRTERVGEVWKGGGVAGEVLTLAEQRKLRSLITFV